ncbi:MAG: hypothetical protein AB1597_01475 [Chloroflexota bacterium]
MKSKTGMVLRIVAIVLMGMATVFTLLGGLGTVCIAWNADKYPAAAFGVFVPFMPVYQTFVYTKVITALIMSAVVYALVKGDKWAYWGAVGTLVVGLAAAALQMFYTSTLKGVSFFQTPPTNVRFYITLLTLVFFLILLIPGIKERASMSGPWKSKGTGAMTGGVTAIVTGIIALTTPFWTAESHTVDGNNLVYVFETPLMVFGWVVLFTGIVLVTYVILGPSREAVIASLKKWLRIAPAAS